ncbi:MAG TPA: MFS transporter [Methylomirabilota bacterium]|nr:MFS transporter [Methylomirabilota bacterium]
MQERRRRLFPFYSPETRRLAALFAIVYFAQGMWYLPNQTITVSFKDLGLKPSDVANFFLITTVPWMLKPLYGLVSDFVPLFGRRRKSYFVLTTVLAAGAGAWLASFPGHTFWGLALLFTAMGFGLAFSDVLTDALMVEEGRPHGLTGAFQSVQWASITTASIAVGELGGYLAEGRALRTAFGIAAGFPMVSLAMVLYFVREPVTRRQPGAFRDTAAGIRAALSGRDVWMVAGFIFFYTFSPSFGPAFLYYQTDELGFSQQFIGRLAALNAAAAVVGALAYAPLARRVRLRPLLNWSIGIGVAGTLSYLIYRGRVSAIFIDTFFGCVGMVMQLAFLDFAAKACPPRVEATFFALLMSVYNAGTQLSQNAGARLYEQLGFTPLVLISATLTALAWVLVPLLDVDRIERQSYEEVRAKAADTTGTGAPPTRPLA